MTGISPAVFGFASITFLAIAALAWIGTRRLLLSPYPSTPLSAVLDGWRAVFKCIRILPVIALGGFAVKLLQILGYSARGLMLGPSPDARFWTGVAIDLIFTLAWAAVAFQIYLLVLAPDLPRDEARQRTRRAILYGFIFWSVTFALSVGGILWIAALTGRGRLIVGTAIGYLPYALIIASALTRPAIAINLPRPFKECRRILSENWFGIAVTLGLAALPLGIVFFVVGLVRQIFNLPLVWALSLEVPIALVSALCYAAFEAAIAATYQRIM